MRALVGLPPIVLFDNASASLDQASDRRLSTVLERYRGARTMIIVSHRPSLLRLCDRCFRIEDGKLNPLDLSPSTDMTPRQLPVVLAGRGQQ